jgi:hypothetical protein
MSLSLVFQESRGKASRPLVMRGSRKKVVCIRKMICLEEQPIVRNSW